MFEKDIISLSGINTWNKKALKDLQDFKFKNLKTIVPTVHHWLVNPPSPSNLTANCHNNVIVQLYVLYIAKGKQFLDDSPDKLVHGDCCKVSLLEITYQLAKKQYNNH